MPPHTWPVAWPDLREGSLAERIADTPPHEARVAILGVPDDTGVSLNGGRPGAAGGPQALRDALARYGTGDPLAGAWPATCFAGDVTPGDSLDETHERVTEAVGALLEAGVLPVLVGGGHDLTYPFLRAVAQAGGPLTVAYADAHLDVRPQPGSGMSVHRLLAERWAVAAHVFGLDAFVNSREHARWFVANGGTIHQASAPIAIPDGERIAVSIDLDVLDQSVAPGVSAMNPNGWLPARAATLARLAGRDARVVAFDVMELNPATDEGGRTARLAAHLLAQFLRGVAERDAAATQGSVPAASPPPDASA